MAGSIAYSMIVIGVLVWCAVLLMLPLASAVHAPLSRPGYDFFTNICHQDDSRSIHIAGYPMAVCARCSGIYFGFFIGVLLSPVLSRRVLLPPRSAWIIAAFPMLLDVGADLLGVHAGTIPTRLASGAFFGIGAALILTPLMITACSELFDQHRRWHHGSKT